MCAATDRFRRSGGCCWRARPPARTRTLRPVRCRHPARGHHRGLRRGFGRRTDHRGLGRKGARQIRRGGRFRWRTRTPGKTRTLRGLRGRRRTRRDHRGLRCGLRCGLGQGNDDGRIGRSGARRRLQPGHWDGLAGGPPERMIHHRNPATASGHGICCDRFDRLAFDPAAIAVHRAQVVDGATVLADPVVAPDPCLERKLLGSFRGGLTREGFPGPAVRPADSAENQPDERRAPEQGEDDGPRLEAHRWDPASRVRVISGRPPVRDLAPG